MNYLFIVLESVIERYFVGNVKVSDRDFYDNVYIFYLILRFCDYDKFWINVLIGEIYINGVFDYEIVENYVILVEVCDSGYLLRMVVILVNIVIMDVNDNFFEFVDRYF